MTPSIGLSGEPSRTVVIVDDDESFVRLLRERIRDAGCRPICARDAREAIAAITHERPAMVLIGLGAPRVHGQELLATLDRSPALARIPRLALTSHGAVTGRESTPWPVSVRVLAIDDQVAVVIKMRLATLRWKGWNR